MIGEMEGNFSNFQSFAEGHQDGIIPPDSFVEANRMTGKLRDTNVYSMLKMGSEAKGSKVNSGLKPSEIFKQSAVYQEIMKGEMEAQQ